MARRRNRSPAFRHSGSHLLPPTARDQAQPGRLEAERDVPMRIGKNLRRPSQDSCRLQRHAGMGERGSLGTCARRALWTHGGICREGCEAWHLAPAAHGTQKVAPSVKHVTCRCAARHAVYCPYSSRNR